MSLVFLGSPVPTAPTEWIWVLVSERSESTGGGASLRATEPTPTRGAVSAGQAGTAAAVGRASKLAASTAPAMVATVRGDLI